MADPTLPEVSPAADVGDAAGRLAARVQAWQHRHPMARRITVGEVAGLGVIALPYGPGPLFHQPNLLPGLSHRALVAFADRHAVAYRPGLPDWPLRGIERSDASTEPAPETRYLLTAAIGGVQPQRLLIAPESPAIWGRRPWSRARVAGALAVMLLAAALGALGLNSVWKKSAAPAVAVPVAAGEPAAPLAVAPTAPPAASVATPGSAPASASGQPPASAPALLRASTPAAAIASPPAKPASAAAAVVPPPLSMPHQKGAASPQAAPGASASATAPTPEPMSGTHYALVSAPVKKREVAEATLDRVRKLLGPAIGRLQAQVMPSPEGFVVTIWPLPTEADAERLAEVLARRGVPMRWLEF